MDIEEIGLEVVDWISNGFRKRRKGGLCLIRQWNWVPQNAANFLTSWGTTSLSKRALFCKINHLVGIQHPSQFVANYKFTYGLTKLK